MIDDRHHTCCRRFRRNQTAQTLSRPNVISSGGPRRYDAAGSWSQWRGVEKSHSEMVHATLEQEISRLRVSMEYRDIYSHIDRQPRSRWHMGRRLIVICEEPNCINALPLQCHFERSTAAVWCRRFMKPVKRSREISLWNGTCHIGTGDLSTQSFNGIQRHLFSYRQAAPLGKRWLNRYRISFLDFYPMQGISRRE